MTSRIVIIRFGWMPFIDVNLKYMIDALCAMGMDVTYIKSRSRALGIDDEPHPVARCDYFRLQCRRLKAVPLLGRVAGPLTWIEYVFRTVWKGLRTSPGLVTAYGLDSLLPAWIVARLKGAKLFFYSEELYTDRPGVPMKPFWNWLERRLIGKADLICTCEPNRSRVLQERYGLDATPMSVLNVPPRQEPPARRDKIRRYLNEHGLPGADAKVIYYHGWVSPGRCADRFVEALQWIERDAILFLVGPIEDDFKGRLLEQARAQGVDGRVVIRGMVPTAELLEYAASAHVGLQVQRNEGLNNYYCAPNKLFQYMAMGVPVIASNFPGMIDVVEGNQVGVCVDPDDSRQIADAANRILADDEQWRAMSANAVRAAQERYCYEVEGKKLLDALCEMVGHGHD
ncbi:MAG: glycosyltransferase [Candidatus Hydrogenedentes bacterium]|nr:glycosyltransferase [Candidatus Hydrogenedentota bacterium]